MLIGLDEILRPTIVFLNILFMKGIDMSYDSNVIGILIVSSYVLVNLYVCCMGLF